MIAVHFTNDKHIMIAELSLAVHITNNTHDSSVSTGCLYQHQCI